MIKLLLALISYLLRQGRKRQEALDAMYPPISDAEFLARCPTGTDPEVALRVRRIVADGLGADYDRLQPSTSFVNDLGVC